MAEEGENSTATEDPRPLTALQESPSRKVPGGFNSDEHDEHDDLRPSKDSLNHSIFVNAEEFAQNHRIPSLDPTSLPQLPPPSDSSLLYTHSENGDNQLDSVDEKAMQWHLNDVESSFLPALSPIGVSSSKGVDDTFLFDGVQAKSGRLSPLRELATPNHNGKTERNQRAQSPLTADDAYRTPGVGLSHDGVGSEENSMEQGDTMSGLETMSSSPTAAAAARTMSRAVPHASRHEIELAHPDGRSEEDQDSREFDRSKESEKVRGDDYDDDADDRSTLRYHASDHSLAADAGSTPGFALSKYRSGSRPKFLRSRHGSQRSSVSSFITNPEPLDAEGLGADYALQSGGSVPKAGGLSRKISLSRTVSLGSMASGIEDYAGHDPLKRGPDSSLSTLNEEDHRERKSLVDIFPPNTPRASTNRSLAAPTDTIIARHVRNVHVPESLAEEYRSKSGTSPNRSSCSRLAIGRNGKNLTLKEQSSTIERLSKENFDLKLKVMFLSDRLEKLSEEGVKEMISENVELKTGLAVMQRDNKALKRKIKDLEKQLKDDEGRPSTARSGASIGEPSPQWFEQDGAQDREEELLYLRERVEEYLTEIERLRHESVQRENDKRNLAEVVRSMGERRGQSVDTREEVEVWKDLLEQETSRREQVDDENKKLREEVFKLQTGPLPAPSSAGLNHTTNIYNITKKRSGSPSRPRSGHSDRMGEDRNGTFSLASTLVEELRKESEQLKHENSELRREVGAQTSMLTSRNREKERLYQEIEDLKLGLRRGAGSVAGESIFERSASRVGAARAHERSSSRTSGRTRQTSMTDTEREDFENKQAELRDRINSLKIHNQDLQRELESCMEDFETAVQQQKESEILAAELQSALELAESDLQTMQKERDEALQGQEEAEIMFGSLRKEAQEELDGFAADIDDSNAEIERLQSELSDTTENFNSLQLEMRQMSEALLRLEDDQEVKLKRIKELEKENGDGNKELEQMDKNLAESHEKINRLMVQQESSQSEISFLREEQDGDKIKIGDLEAAQKILEHSLQEEKECSRELDQRLSSERHQRKVVAGREKQEVQQFINELNKESSAAKDEARKLRKNLTSREVEAAEWKQRLMELESNLREALGDLNGTRSSLLSVCFFSYFCNYVC
ncbi:hypothetical protein BJ878DRAFT_307905 [Calycina marina]|uniref:Centrosomin N-terminal motif 1 domain-containing protein n=1 Tax=Calycina marina TaxID=1763456 RepID=A0A9P7YV25_9HELO|nr:hypothetical protein BJ878DRAFT_307905 [Calycina marina]